METAKLVFCYALFGAGSVLMLWAIGSVLINGWRAKKAATGAPPPHVEPRPVFHGHTPPDECCGYGCDEHGKCGPQEKQEE